MNETRVPEGWETRSLFEIGEISMCKRILKHQTSLRGDIPFYKIGTFGKQADSFITKSLYNEYKKKYSFPKKNDILISASGTIGRTIKYNGKPAYFQDSNIIWIDNHENIVINDLLFYCYQIIKWNTEGSTISRLYNNNFKKLFIHIPKSKQEQQKIAEILSEVDSAIDKTKQLIEKNKRLKIALMQDLLSYGIDENGQIRNPKTHQFKPSPLGDIPVEWDCTAIGKSVYLKARIGWQGLTTEEYQKDGDYLLITGIDFKDGKIDWARCFYVDKSRYDQDTKIQIKDNDILVTKDGTIGKVAIVENIPKKATLNSGVFVLRPLNSLLFSFYLFIILTSKYFEKFIENLSAGSTINHLYQKDFINFQFPFPKSKTEQQKIADILSSQDEKIEKLQNKLTKLNHLKASLMQDLLSGKVRVNKLLESKQ